MKKFVIGIIAVALIQIAYVVSSLRDRTLEVSANLPSQPARATAPVQPEASITGPESGIEEPAADAVTVPQKAKANAPARASRAKLMAGRGGDAPSRISERAAFRGRADKRVGMDFGTVVILYNGPTAGPKAQRETHAKVKSDFVAEVKPKPAATTAKPAAEKIQPVKKKRSLFARVIMPVVKSPWRLMKAIGSSLN